MGKQDINSEDHKLKSVYQFIVGYFKKYEFSPSFREISLGTDIKSTSTIREKLKILERAGLVSLNECQPRAIQLMGYKYIKRGISREDTQKSNQAKKEICNNFLMSLRKKEILSDEELQMVEDAFYSTAEGYVFKEKME